MAVTDEDLQKLRAEVSDKFNAVSVDVMGTLTALSDHVSRFNRLETRLDAIDRRVDEGFRRHDVRFDKLDDRFDRLEDRFDKRSMQVDQRFLEFDAKFEQRFDGVDRRFEANRAELLALRNRMERLFGWQAVLAGGLGALVVFAEPIRAALGL